MTALHGAVPALAGGASGPAVLPLAQTPAPSGVSAGYVALLIVVLLGLATVLLIRNMSGRLKRLPPRFPDRPDRTPDQRPPAG